MIINISLRPIIAKNVKFNLYTRDPYEKKMSLIRLEIYSRSENIPEIQ